MTQALLNKVLAARKFNQGFTTTEYLTASLIDQAWYQLKPDQIPTDAVAFEKDVLHKAGADLATVSPRYHSTYFSHVFASGYSAGYYSYIWAQVLDSDIGEWFKEHGGFYPHNPHPFRTTHPPPF